MKTREIYQEPSCEVSIFANEEILCGSYNGTMDVAPFIIDDNDDLSV